MTLRQAVITYDPDRVSKWEIQSEGGSIIWIMSQALTGQPYPRERGIVEIRHVPEDKEIVMVPRMTLGRQDNIS